LRGGKVWFKFADDKEVDNINSKYPLAKVGVDNDAIRAAAQAIRQSIEMMSPEMMRQIGFFKGNWIEGKVIYSEIENIIPYSVGVNYIELLRIVDGNGSVVVKDTILERLEKLLGTITVTSDVVQYEGDNLSSVRFYVSSKSSS
jgi:hypothetical protein